MEPTSVVRQVDLKCPVCAAGFRGVETCTRCGTNLQPLMSIAARAWALRQESRAKLRAGSLPEALSYAIAAWELQRQWVQPTQ